MGRYAGGIQVQGELSDLRQKSVSGSPESVIEGNCPKCGSALVIRYSNTGVAVTVSVSEDKREETIKVNMPKR